MLQCSAYLQLVLLKNLYIPARFINNSCPILLFLVKWNSGTLKVFRYDLLSFCIDYVSPIWSFSCTYWFWPHLQPKSVWGVFLVTCYKSNFRKKISFNFTVISFWAFLYRVLEVFLWLVLQLFIVTANLFFHLVCLLLSIKPSQDCKKFQGELFGICNLFRDLSGKLFTKEIIETHVVQELLSQPSEITKSSLQDMEGDSSNKPNISHNKRTLTDFGRLLLISMSLNQCMLFNNINWTFRYFAGRHFVCT